jgi:hypothetical protein
MHNRQKEVFRCEQIKRKIKEDKKGREETGKRQRQKQKEMTERQKRERNEE